MKQVTFLKGNKVQSGISVGDIIYTSDGSKVYREDCVVLSEKHLNPTPFTETGRYFVKPIGVGAKDQIGTRPFHVQPSHRHPDYDVYIESEGCHYIVGRPHKYQIELYPFFS